MKNSKKSQSSIRQTCVLAKVIVIGAMTLACIGHFLINPSTYINWSQFQTTADIGLFVGSIVSLVVLFGVLLSMFAKTVRPQIGI